MQKRERDDDDEGDDHLLLLGEYEDEEEEEVIMKTQERIGKYNAAAKLRLEEKSTRVASPPEANLTEQCLIWNGCKRDDGSGSFSYNGKSIGPHVAALMISKGVDSLPKKNKNGENLDVSRLCGIRDCCEETHLYLTTRAERGLLLAEKNALVKIGKVPVEKTQEQIDKYNIATKLRLEKYSERVASPPEANLTEQCLIWNRYKRGGGYGRFSYNGKPIGTHAAALMISKGVNVLPEYNENGEALETGHVCNRPACCEATHLYLATKAQNGEDTQRNGLLRGEKHPNAKISEETARDIKISKGEGTIMDRAKRFNVSTSIVSSIDAGVAWSHLPNVNGEITTDKKIEKGKRESLRKKELGEIPWSKELADLAQEKFDDPEFAEEDETKSFNGTNCIIWKRSMVHGYPQMYIGGQQIRAHVMAAFISNNYVRPEKLQSSHNCNNPACINHLHLQFKTPVENSKDKIANGTSGRKLSSEQVSDIRQCRTNGESYISLAERYDITSKYVSLIVRKKARING